MSPTDRRFRLSDRFPDNDRVAFEGTLEKRFSPYFDYLLDSEHAPEDNSDFYEIYVPDQKIAKAIHSRVASVTSRIMAITGARGIGKSTSIRYFFGVTDYPKITRIRQINDKQQAIDPECLVIPFYLDATSMNEQNVDRILTKQVQAAAEVVIAEKQVTVDDDLLHEFIITHKPRLVTFPYLPLNCSIRDRISALRSEDSYAYVSELLKLALYKSGITRVVLIVDDIESCSYSTQKELVKGILKLRDCLKNTGKLSRAYRPDYIFTCRPATFKMLSRDPEIDGFSIGNPIEIVRPADLGDIVRKRFEYVRRIIGEGKAANGKLGSLGRVQNLSAWQEAYATLEIIIDRVASVGADFIVSVNNYDVRRSLKDLQEILKNSRWYERGHSAGAFDVREEDYRISTAPLVRAMVLRDRTYFSQDLESPVPNLFWNRAAPSADLMLMHIIKFFFEKTRSQSMVAVPVSEIRKALLIPYTAGALESDFDDVLQYAVYSELVRIERVWDAKEKMVEIYCIPMHKTFYIWKMCKEISVFLEFFRDNTYLFHRLLSQYPAARFKGTSLLSADEKFVLCCDFACEIADQERVVLDLVRGNEKLDEYNRVFGSRLISVSLLRGLQTSIRRLYGGSSRDSVPKVVSSAIRRCRSAVGKVNSV